MLRLLHRFRQRNAAAGGLGQAAGAQRGGLFRVEARLGGRRFKIRFGLRGEGAALEIATAVDTARHRPPPP